MKKMEKKMASKAVSKAVPKIEPAKFNTMTFALTMGIVFVIAHTLNVLSIFGGAMNFWQMMHFVSIQYTVTGFTFLQFIVGILTAFVYGFVFGWLVAYIYNKLLR